MSRNYVLPVICIITILLVKVVFCQSTPIDLVNYDINATIDLSNKQLDVLASLYCQKTDTLGKGTFLLSSDVSINSIQYSENGQFTDISFSQTGKDTLLLTIPADLKLESYFTLSFSYSFPFEESEDEVIILGRGNRWYPLVYDDIAKSKITITTPQTFIALAPGELINEKETANGMEFTWQTNIPVFKIALIAAKSKLFDVTTRTIDNKNI